MSETPFNSAPPMPPMPGGMGPQDAPAEYETSFSISEEDFKEMQEGMYNAILIKVTKGESKAKNPMYSWTYAITEGESSGEELMNFTAITPAAMWKLKETLVGLGIEPVNGLYNFKAVDHTTDPIGVINRKVTLSVLNQEYNGQVRASIDKVLPYGTK